MVYTRQPRGALVHFRVTFCYAFITLNKLVSLGTRGDALCVTAVHQRQFQIVCLTFAAAVVAFLQRSIPLEIVARVVAVPFIGNGVIQVCGAFSQAVTDFVFVVRSVEPSVGAVFRTNRSSGNVIELIDPLVTRINAHVFSIFLLKVLIIVTAPHAHQLAVAKHSDLVDDCRVASAHTFLIFQIDQRRVKAVLFYQGLTPLCTRAVMTYLYLIICASLCTQKESFVVVRLLPPKQHVSAVVDTMIMLRLCRYQ